MAVFLKYISEVNSPKRLHEMYLFGIVLLNLLSAIFILPIDDEMYYWTWSQQLDWGYYDHPPMVALFMKLSQIIPFQGLDIRIFSILTTLVSLRIWGEILKPNNKKEVHLLYLLYLSVLAFQIFGFVTTPDAPLWLFGTLYLWRLQKTIDQPSWWNFTGLALCMAGVMYSKYFGVLLIGFTLLALLPQWGKNVKLYFAGIMALICYLPHLFWQWEHDWVSFEYHLQGRARQNDWNPTKLLNYLLGLVLFGSFLFWTLPFKAWKNVNQSYWEKSLRYTILGCLVVFIPISTFLHTQAQWNVLIYMAMFPLAYLYFKKNSIKKWQINIAFIGIGLILLLRIVLCFNPAFSPMTKLKEFVQEVSKTAPNTPVLERYQQVSAYQYYIKNPVYSYRAYNHRKSQFELWNNEEKMQGKSLSFYALEPIGKDSIQDNYNKWEYRNEVAHFKSFPKVTFKVMEAFSQKDSKQIQLKAIYINPYSVGIEGLQDQQSIILIGFNEKGFPVFQKTLSDQFYLNPTHRGTIDFTFTMGLQPDLTKYALGLRPAGVSGKMQSDYFEFIPISH